VSSLWICDLSLPCRAVLHVPECANNATNSIYRRDVSFYFIPPPSLPLSVSPLPPSLPLLSLDTNRLLTFDVDAQKITRRNSHQLGRHPSDVWLVTFESRSTLHMTFPPPETLSPPGYNDYRNNGPRKLPKPPSSTATTTSPFPPSRTPQKHTDYSRPRMTSVTASAVGGSQGVPAAKRSDTPTEFCISVDLYLPSGASVGLRKVRFSLPPLPLSRLPFRQNIS
jgi:hypothetical protein